MALAGVHHAGANLSPPLGVDLDRDRFIAADPHPDFLEHPRRRDPGRLDVGGDPDPDVAPLLPQGGLALSPLVVLG